MIQNTFLFFGMLDKALAVTVENESSASFNMNSYYMLR